MKKLLLLAILATPFIYSNSFAAECGIMFGGGGKNSQWLTLNNNQTTSLSNIGGPWDFIRETYGPCTFNVYNNKFKGKRIQYGSNISQRVRVGAKGGQDRGGWRARSVVIIPRNNQCSITLGDGGISQTFYGTGKVNRISGWGFVRSTSGNSKCSYRLYNGSHYDGRLSEVRKVNSRIKMPWRIRSIEVQLKN